MFELMLYLCLVYLPLARRARTLCVYLPAQGVDVRLAEPPERCEYQATRRHVGRDGKLVVVGNDGVNITP